MSFKYSLGIYGNATNKELFEKELILLGYTKYDRSYITLNSLLPSLAINSYNSWPQNGQYEFQSGANSQRDYTFHINSLWEYRAALAIAAIHDDAEYHENEWVIFDGLSEGWNSGEIFTIGKLYQLGGKFWRGDYKGDFNVKEDNRGNPNGYTRGLLHKATPEEIIEFFKNKYMYNQALDGKPIWSTPQIADQKPSFDRNSSSLVDDTDIKPEVKARDNREIIGYRTIKDGPGFKAGLELTLFTRAFSNGESGYRSKTENGVRIRFPNSVLADTEWFEPIYKEVLKKDSIVVGSNADMVTIYEDGKISSANIGNFNISAVENIINYYGGKKSDLQINGYNVAASIVWRGIRIGCEDEDHRFSLDDLNNIVSTYKRLKSN